MKTYRLKIRVCVNGDDVDRSVTYSDDLAVEADDTEMKLIIDMLKIRADSLIDLLDDTVITDDRDGLFEQSREG